MVDQEKGKTMSRREFIKKSGYVTGGLIGGGILGGLVGAQFRGELTRQASQELATLEKPSYDQALMYFTNHDDFNVLKAATERIFPEDENGPGAIGLGVPFFIDHQLAGQWGINAREYMQGPFYEGTPTQGYQTRLKRHEIFDLGIKAIKDYSQKKYNKPFTELEGEEQDEVLTALEEGQVEMPGVSSSLFFELLRTATLEGAYADPLYGGNKDMMGWKMKEFPGDQASYRDQIESEEFIKIEPKSLRDHHNG